jgi:hypothetical protein
MSQQLDLIPEKLKRLLPLSRNLRQCEILLLLLSIMKNLLKLLIGLLRYDHELEISDENWYLTEVMKIS